MNKIEKKKHSKSSKEKFGDPCSKASDVGGVNDLIKY